MHVGEIRTELAATRGSSPDAPDAAGEGVPPYPGIREDEWRGIQSHVLRLRDRVCAEGFDD
ncbi:hypothetical protein [Agrococcus sp. DT81.2]|uniref:hypothetical protein n=1 Tax=Agrococcus sp. DT81.2 TaxID=3393414 RepID=UPI003CE4B289